MPQPKDTINCLVTGADSLRLPNGKLRRLKPSPLVSEGTDQVGLPLGLLPVSNVSHVTRSLLRSPVLRVEKEWFSPSVLACNKPLFFSKQAAAYAERMEKLEKPLLDEPLSSKRIGFSVSRFRSGEMTGGRFATGLDSAVSLNPRTGLVITQSLTQKARTKIRRAIQNAEHNFKCFLTVTFSPGHLHPWECDADGTVRHDFAKYKFKKFLHSIKVSYDRKSATSGRSSDLLAYVWVAEIQLKSTNNIHFHVLLNQRPPIKWLSALWGQASNSIDVRSINNLNHASCYIRKYMEKEKSSVQGNRYGITQGLRASMLPNKTVFNGREEQRGVFEIVLDMIDTIELNGGKVLEHGFYLPTPCRSVVFLGKDGKTKKSIAVSAGLSVYMLEQMTSFVAPLPF